MRILRGDKDNVDRNSFLSYIAVAIPFSKRFSADHTYRRYMDVPAAMKPANRKSTAVDSTLRCDSSDRKTATSKVAAKTKTATIRSQNPPVIRCYVHGKSQAACR
jgi:hypothetical protein